MAEKHRVINNREAKNSSLPYGCGCWKAILNSLEEFKEGTMIEVGTGAKTRFWKDRWCSSRPLMVEHPNLLQLARNNEVMTMDY